MEDGKWEMGDGEWEMGDGEWIDRLVWSLSGGDIVKGKEIYERVTYRESLEWLRIGRLE